MSFFGKIFRKKELMVPFDFSLLVNDLHSHLIPGIDDGAKNMADSLVLAKGLQELGYKKAITTPHIMSDYYRNTPEIIKSGLSDLNAELTKENISLEVKPAAEYYIDFDFVNKIGKEELLTFGDKYILVEFSFIEPPKNFKEAFFELQTNGYKPILAHPERYMYWNSNHDFLFELKDRDVLFQTNILSLRGNYGPGVLKTAEVLIKNKMVNFLGTDLHNEYQLNELKQLHLPEGLINNINNLDLLNSIL
ncbi:MAG: capsular biosynthesis protein [Salinivirgaceae bacterium]|nr:capsular biosynthesis protein [Salinivirgaceae bacterium]